MTNTTPTEETGRPFEMPEDAQHAQALSNKPKPINHEGEAERDRTINNRPRDPNGFGTGKDLPPGVDAEIARDPGAKTPSTNAVRNDSGTDADRT